MDPNATADRLRDAMAREDYADAREAWIDLMEWVDSGGFQPEGWERLERDFDEFWTHQVEVWRERRS